MPIVAYKITLLDTNSSTSIREQWPNSGHEFKNTKQTGGYSFSNVILRELMDDGGASSSLEKKERSNNYNKHR